MCIPAICRYMFPWTTCKVVNVSMHHRYLELQTYTHSCKSPPQPLHMTPDEERHSDLKHPCTHALMMASLLEKSNKGTTHPMTPKEPHCLRKHIRGQMPYPRFELPIPSSRASAPSMLTSVSITRGK